MVIVVDRLAAAVQAQVDLSCGAAERQQALWLRGTPDGWTIMIMVHIASPSGLVDGHDCGSCYDSF